jgi:large repetitive protein
LALLVNGQEVPEGQVGKKISDPDRQLEVWEYVGVRLEPGSNDLEVILTDPFGNERARRSIRVVAPGNLARIRLEVPPGDLVADGKTPVPVSVYLEDAHGVPVTSRTPLLLESNVGLWEVRDLNPNEPGTQVFVQGGHGEFALVPPSEPLKGEMRVSSGAVERTMTLAFVPDLRPMLAVGLVEGSINFNRAGRGGIFPASSRDGFEEELRSFATSGSDSTAAGRAAFFLKGKVRGDYLLTAAYDSEKDVRERLFRDIQPDEYYPVYGDESVRGFDAQSSGRLYVRIDKRRSYLLLGDFTTEGQSEARGLANYHRSLNGVRHHFENDFVTANAWAAYDSTRQVVEEIPANGTSGPYNFRTANGLVNSERVEILTRDRNQRSIIIHSEPMLRFIDYEFEPFTGRLLFKRPIPSLDRDLNPISIRITYEVDQGGDSFWVYGADAQVQVHERVAVGGSFVEDENPLDPFSMQSVNSTMRVTQNTVAIAEYARSESLVRGTGDGVRAEVRHQTERNDVRVFYGETDDTFANPGSVLAPGRVEMGTTWAHQLAPRDRLLGKALWTEDVVTGGIRKGARLDWEHTFLNNVRWEFGGRVSTETAAPASETTAGVTPNDVVSLRTRLTTPVPRVTGLTVYGEVENDVIEADKRMIAAGGDYQLSQRTKAYARHEFINALGGPFELNNFQRNHQTVVGLETEYMKDAHFFNEYRARDSFTGREAEAATGLRNRWLLREGVTADTSFERVSPFSEFSRLQESTAATAAIDFHHDPDWRLATRVEGRVSTQADSFLHTLNYGRRISADWTWLNRTIFYYADNKAPQMSDRLQGRFQTGFAYRQTEQDRFNALMKYEFRYEDGSLDPQFEEALRMVHIISADGHYQPTRDWMFSLHYAGKFVQEDWSDFDDDYHAHLLSGRVIYNLTERWDVGIIQSVFFDRDFASVRYGVGPEVGYTLKQNVRLGAGYNIFGFYDRDFSDRNTAPGFYINLRMKFDENSFRRSGG